MAIKRVQSSMSVVDAAVIRILNTFKQGVKVYLAFSAGKDSLCLSHMVYSLIKQGKIDPKQLTVFGSSPRAWGLHTILLPPPAGIRFIPTCVGLTLPRLLR